MSGNVVVFGISPDTVMLEDIQMDVPHSTSVTIPEDLALKSKDLWRALSQRKIFRLTSDLNPHKVFTASPAPLLVSPPPSDDQERVTSLAHGYKQLQDEVERLLPFESANVQLARELDESELGKKYALEDGVILREAKATVEAELSTVTAANVQLTNDIARLQGQLDLYEAQIGGREKLDEILKLLKERPVVIMQNTGGLGILKAVTDVVGGDAPAFIPSTIASKDMDAHVEVQSETSEGSSVSGASAALKKKRQGN